MLVVTAADSGYLRCVCQLLRSLERVGLATSRVVVVDLGFSPQEAALVAQEFPFVDLRCFPFERYPDFVHPRHGNYAWKPLAIAEVARSADRPILWLDSATVLLRPPHPIAAAVSACGVYVPFGGGGTVPAHPKAVELLASRGLGTRWTGLRARTAGVCGLDPGVPAVRQLLTDWSELALIPDCIAPAGSSKADHHHDQTILTALLYRGQERGDWVLTQDELDVSSSRPVDFLIARAKLPRWVPLWLDRPAVGMFRLLSTLDVWHWKLRRLGTPVPGPDQPVR